MPHIHDQIDFTATAYIVCGGYVLLRRHEKLGIWIGVGGHIELDEEPNEAVIREAREEVGLDITLVSSKDNNGKLDLIDNTFERNNVRELIPPEFLNIHNVTPDHRHIDLVYFATSRTYDILPENNDDEWEWLSNEGIEKMRQYLPYTGYWYSKKALAFMQGI